MRKDGKRVVTRNVRDAVKHGHLDMGEIRTRGEEGQKHIMSHPIEGA